LSPESNGRPVGEEGKKYTFVEGDSIKTLHKLLNIKLMYGYSFQSFLDLMQRVAEEKVREPSLHFASLAMLTCTLLRSS
jgi:hypothetical protein